MWQVRIECVDPMQSQCKPEKYETSEYPKGSMTGNDSSKCDLDAFYVEKLAGELRV